MQRGSGEAPAALQCATTGECIQLSVVQELSPTVASMLHAGGSRRGLPRRPHAWPALQLREGRGDPPTGTDPTSRHQGEPRLRARQAGRPADRLLLNGANGRRAGGRTDGPPPARDVRIPHAPRLCIRDGSRSR